MKNGPKDFAPETAIGTGAAEPVVDEVEAAKQVPSVDESTAGRGQNQPGNEGKTIEYSGQTLLEAYEDLETEAGDTDTEPSTGQDYETRQADKDDEPGGDAVGSVLSDDEVNSKAEDVRPEAPQATKQSRAKRSS